MIPIRPKPFLALFLIPSLCVLPLLARAAEKNDRWYDIELIVFSQDRGEGSIEENWPEIRILPSIEDAYSLTAAPPATTATDPLARVPALDPDPGAGSRNAPLPYPILGKDERLLQDEWNKLRWSVAHTPLLHTGWRQPALAKKDAPVVRIKTKTTGPDGLEVDGTIQVAVSRYLHVYTDLILSEPPIKQTPVIDLSTWQSGFSGLWEDSGMETNSSLSPPIRQQYRLKQHRRMRRDELHYIDHPMFGILIEIHRYEPPPEPAPTPVETDLGLSPKPPLN